LALGKDGTLYRWGNSTQPSAGVYSDINGGLIAKVVPEPIHFVVGGQTLKLGLSPVYDKESLMVPRTVLWPKLGVEIKLSYSKPDKNNRNYWIWTLSKGDKSIVYADSKAGIQVTVNGKLVQDAPQLKTVYGSIGDGMTMIPLLYTCNKLGIPYSWDDQTRTYSF
jgi:hypothetical protein